MLKINKKILITGGTGQIGSFLTETLEKKYQKVVVLGRKKTEMKEIAQLVKTKKIKFIECDLTKQKQIEKITKELLDIDYLIHLSSNMESNLSDIKNVEYLIELELKGTIHLLSKCKNLEKIVYSSSMAVYGKPKYNPVDEKCPTNPITIYGCTKLATEKFLEIFSKNNGISLSILRFSSIYGPRNRTKRSIPYFIDLSSKNKSINLINGGNGYRDFIHVSDAVNFIVKALKKNQIGIFNIGYGKKTEMKKLAKEIITLNKSKSKINFLKKLNDFNFVYDMNHAIKTLNYKPKISLEEGLKTEINWRKLGIESNEN
jgi:nucleoside-diphosphate-sugar epimerase